MRGPGGKIDKQKKKKKQKKKHPLRHRERGALESAGPVAYATFATRLIRHCYWGTPKTALPGQSVAVTRLSGFTVYGRDNQDWAGWLVIGVRGSPDPGDLRSSQACPSGVSSLNKIGPTAVGLYMQNEILELL